MGMGGTSLYFDLTQDYFKTWGITEKKGTGAGYPNILIVISHIT